MKIYRSKENYNFHFIALFKNEKKPDQICD
mgnify:FL=1